MDIFIAGLILMAAVAWDSSQELLNAVSLAPTETHAPIELSVSAETVATECARGESLIIARDLTVQAIVETPAHGY